MKASKRSDLLSQTSTRSVNPFSAKAWITEAREANNKRDYERAIEYFNKYLKADPSNMEVLLELSNALYSSGRYDEAIENYEDAIDRSEKEKETSRNNRILVAEALKGKGNSLAAKGYYEEALKYYDRAIIEGKNPKTSNDALYNKAVVHFKLKDYKKADELFKVVIDKNRNDELAWRGKAAALEKLGKKDEAFDALVRSMKSASLKLKKIENQDGTPNLL